MSLSMSDAAKLREKHGAKDISFPEGGSVRFYFGAAEIEVDAAGKMTFARRTGSKLIDYYTKQLEDALRDGLLVEQAHNEAMIETLEWELGYLEMRTKQIASALELAKEVDDLLVED